MSHSNKRISIVTGGASGIGLAIAKAFAANNIFVIIIGRDKQKLENAQAEIGANCTAISYDLNDLEGIPGLINDIVREYGNIDILVNNAGVNLKKEFCDVTNEEFSRIIHTNLISVFSLSREVVKNMLANQGGSIINISSMTAHYGLPKVIAYSASKTAIEGMTRAMASELSSKGIRINCIAPGFIGTDMSSKALESDPDRKQRVLARTPMGKLGETSDIGAAALYLCSEGAKFVTGATLPVDGGNSIGF